MTDVVAVVADLIFATKIVGTARSLGFTAKSVSSTQALEGELKSDGARLVVVDMGLPDDEAVQALRAAAAYAPAAKRLAFFSHVRKEQKDAAREAGATWIMPRSQFSAELPSLLARVLQANSNTQSL